MADAKDTRDRMPTPGRRPGPRWLPVLLMAAGAACLVYGFAVHTVTVMPKAREAGAADAEATADDVPPEILPEEEPIFSPDVLFGEGPADGEPVPMPVEEFGDVDEPPPPEPYDFSEARVVREVTIGGLHRLPTGEIVRTYGPNEKAPAFCPT